MEKQNKTNKKKQRNKFLVVMLFIAVTVPLMASTCGGTPAPTAVGSFTVNMNAVDIVKSSASVAKTMTVNINRLDGFSGDVSLELEGLPANASQQWNPNTTSGDSAQVTITVQPNAADYNGPITVKGVSGSISASKIVNLRISDKKDTTRPTIVSLKPAPNTRGVSENAKLIIEFSEPMNQESAQAAFEDMANVKAIGPVAFSWSNDGKKMTVNPINGLDYSDNDKAIQYSYRTTSTAKDLAGNKLDSSNSNRVSTFFFTYRTLSKRLDVLKGLDGYVGKDKFVNNSDDNITVGDTASNRGIRGFISFDISGLPNDLIKIKEARIILNIQKTLGNPSLLGPVYVESINYGNTLDIVDYNLSSDAARVIGQLKLNTRKLYALVTELVQNDWEKRKSLNSRSQLRLRQAKETNNNSGFEQIRFYSGDYNNPGVRPIMWVKFLAP